MATRRLNKEKNKYNDFNGIESPVEECSDQVVVRKKQQQTKILLRSRYNKGSLLALMTLLLSFSYENPILKQLLRNRNGIRNAGSNSMYVYASDGVQHYKVGQKLFEEGKYDEAAMELWRAILLHTATPTAYDVTTVFQEFMRCYIIQNKVADGFAFVSLESYKRGQTDMGYNYLQQTLQIDPNNAIAKSIQQQYVPSNKQQSTTNAQPTTTTTTTTTAAITTTTIGSSSSVGYDVPMKTNDDLLGNTPEKLYEIASLHFSNKNYEECADIFELSCQRSGNTLGPSCANAVYCRSLIVDWGYNGTQFDRDMERIIELTTAEVQQNRFITADDTTKFAWKRSVSVHPHMMLGYPIDPLLKRYAAESASYLDEKMARANMIVTGTPDSAVVTHESQLPQLPVDMPFNVELMQQQYQNEFRNNPDEKIRVGFVGSGFNSKAVLYLSQDMFRFFNTEKFEIHVFSFGPADNPLFIKHGMRNVDWRERVKANVDYFHDCRELQLHTDHIGAARYINNHKIHILIEWDGFARQGERAQGLFALRPAPIQILHQEYLGTSGALYVDYLFSDQVTSPPSTLNLYTEKLIWMPNHFFSKGHAYQDEVRKPTYDYKPAQKPYVIVTGSPHENRCLSPNKNQNVSFVFCNFNKLLKANPETVRSWIRILNEVPNSILCLLENPTTAVPYFRKFIYEAAGTFQDGEVLNSRIHFLPWEKNPFDHQARNQDMCNIMLDSHPYNGHTVAQDSLYGGVPIVTRSDGIDMSSRVSTSANIVLGLERLNAYEGPTQYENIAIATGNNHSLYTEIRRHLINTCLQRNPMHRYWDVARYVKNFESGLEVAWKRFLNGLQPDNILIEESPTAAKGTYDEEIVANPQDGKKSLH